MKIQPFTLRGLSGHVSAEIINTEELKECNWKVNFDVTATNGVKV